MPATIRMKSQVNPCAPRQNVRVLANEVAILFTLLLIPTPESKLAVCQESIEPVVARMQMRLLQGENVIDVIEKGDLLTVLKDRDDSYLILTAEGKSGLVSKENALRLVESVEIFDELIRDDPKVGRYYTLRASAWWARGNVAKALVDYNQAIQAGYTEPHAYSSRGIFHSSLGNYETAISDFTTAINLEAETESEFTSDDSSHINRAFVYVTQEKFELAIKDYDEAIRRKPKKASTYHQRAVAKKLNGQPRMAIVDFDKAIQLEPQNVSAWMGRGYVWLHLGDYTKAIRDFSQVIEFDPKSAQAFNNRGYSGQLLGLYEDALNDYEHAIELAPDFALAYQNKAMLLSAANDNTIRNGKEAIKAATKACELNGFRVVGDVKALAAAFAEDEQFGKAIGWQEKAVELADDKQRPTEQIILEGYQDKKPLRMEDSEKME